MAILASQFCNRLKLLIVKTPCLPITVLGVRYTDDYLSGTQLAVSYSGGLLVKKPPAQVHNLSLLRAIQRVQRTIDDRLPPAPVVRADSAAEPSSFKDLARPLSARQKWPR
jgi:hypothetical protein